MRGDRAITIARIIEAQIKCLFSEHLDMPVIAVVDRKNKLAMLLPAGFWFREWSACFTCRHAADTHGFDAANGQGHDVANNESVRGLCGFH